MDKALLTMKMVWNDVDVVAYRLIGNLKTQFTPYEYYEGDLFRVVNGHSMKVDVQRIAKNQLTIGKGVLCNDYIMFLEKTKEHKIFKEAFDKTVEEYESFLDGVACRNIIDYYNVPVIKFLLSMYKNKVFGDKIIKQKLSGYMSIEGVEEVFAEFQKKTVRESA